MRGEREYVVEPLRLAIDSDATSPADLVRAPAVRLFVDRARDVQPDFQLTVANGPTVAAICRRLDTLPLALELAAPWMKVLTADELLRRLERDALFTAAIPRGLPARQQTMNATVAWSYQLLDPDGQRAFRRFGALPGLFPIDAAAAVLAGRKEAGSESEALRAAASLIDKSLLVRAKASVVATCPLYEMLETVRAYAALELAASGERDDAMEGLARDCSGEAALAASGLIGPAQIEWLDRVREDLQSYRGALAWLLDRERPAEAADIASGLMFFWVIRGHAAEGLAVVRTGVGAADAAGGVRIQSAPRGGPHAVRARRARSLHAPGSRALARVPWAPALRRLSRRSSACSGTSSMRRARRYVPRLVRAQPRELPTAGDPVGYRERADRPGSRRARGR